MKRFALTRILLVVTVALSLCSAAVYVMFIEGNSAGPTACWFEIPKHLTASCRYVAVPAFRDGRDGPELLLPVAVLSWPGKRRSLEPVVIVNGGPGGPSLVSVYPEYEVLRSRLSAIAPVLAGHDVIVYDPRGTGLAEPSLNCTEMDQVSRDAVLPWGNDAAFDEREEAAAIACRIRLMQDGIDFSMISTPANADDLAAILDDLGYQKADIWAVSYGTRVALAFLRQHPDRIRSVVLDGVDPQHINTGEAVPASTARAFNRLFVDCAERLRCSLSYPDLASRFEAMVSRLNELPEEASLRWSRRWPDYGMTRMDGDSVVLALFDSLYDSRSLPLILFAVHEAANGDLSSLSSHFEFSYLGDYGLDEGVFIALWCRERFPFIRPLHLQEAVRQHGIYGRLWVDLADPDYCAGWGSEPARPEELAPVSSGLPVLLISGSYDPVTPPEFAEDAARYLSNSRHLEFRGAGHVPSFEGGCATDLVVRFLADPDPARLQEPADCALYSKPAPIPLL